jgi:hypothetical protein
LTECRAFSPNPPSGRGPARLRPGQHTGQLLDRQQHALAEAGCLRVFAGKLSGKNADRSELAACLNYLRPGKLGRRDPEAVPVI